MINLNNISLKVLHIIVIILLLTATFFFYTEIYFIKKHGGQCVDNPMAWAEKYAREKGVLVDCSCKQIGDDFELNLTDNLE